MTYCGDCTFIISDIVLGEIVWGYFCRQYKMATDRVSTLLRVVFNMVKMNNMEKCDIDIVIINEFSLLFRSP